MVGRKGQSFVAVAFFCATTSATFHSLTSTTAATIQLAIMAEPVATPKTFLDLPGGERVSFAR